jgi:hypothetical protein
LPEALSEARLFEPAAIDKISLAIQDVEIIDSIDPELEASPAPGMFIGQQSAPSRVTVFEHTTILDNALNFAKNRLMIFSPWIKGGVVNRSFLRKLETLLIRGVEVYIVYGIGEAEDNSQWCLDKLCELSSRFPAFQFYRHQNTHAKAFIVDDCVIQTSFNWLSFAGDENRTYRMEEGMKYIGATVADPWFDAYSKLLEHEAELACS